VPAPLLIADVPWLLYRAFFSLPKSIKGSDGRPVNALLGTVNALLSAIEARPPRAVVACFGAEEAAYRVNLYSPYHAHRDPMPPALAEQWTRAPRLLESFGWTIADAHDLEADDAMGSFAQAEARSGGRALLLTADRDLYQAVDDRVAVLALGKGDEEPSEIDPTQVRERYGIPPALVPDFIALRGDPSDGLPGAPGIGAKTAAELLQAHGSLEGVLVAAGATAGTGGEAGGGSGAGTSGNAGGESAGGVDGGSAAGGEMRPRIAAALRENAELLRTFKEIATLVEIDVERPADRASDFAGGARGARELGMERLAKRLEGLASAS
jgi:5'-3' exonuclease